MLCSHAFNDLGFSGLGTCAEGWTRHAYPEQCAPCEYGQKFWVNVAMVILGYLKDGLIYLIFAWMNAYAVNKGRSPVQTVLIRVAMSWGLAVSVLGEFSLSQLPVAEERWREAVRDKHRFHGSAKNLVRLGEEPH